MKILFFIGTDWAFGRIHEDLVRVLAAANVTADVLDWRRSYPGDLVRGLSEDYDLVVTVPTEARILVSDYGVDPKRIVVVAHGESDLKKTPLECWPSFAGFAVVADGLVRTARDLGIERIPQVVRIGVDGERFWSPHVPTAIHTLGYASTLERIEWGVDIKRGHLAARIARELGIEFRPVPQGTHMLAMPAYYRSVDAVIVTSLVESVSLPALEAAASGRVVLGAPVGVLPELAERGAALLLPVQEDELVAEAIRVLRGLSVDPAGLRKQCLRARETARHRYAWNDCVTSWLGFFEALV